MRTTNENETGRDVEIHRRHPLLLAMLAAVMLSLTACGGGGGGGGDTSGMDDGYDDPGDDDDDDPDPGTGGDDDDDNDDPGGGTGGGLQPTLASIQAEIFTPICTQCHTGASAPQGLRLEEGMSYGMLVGVASAEVPSLLRVDPGNPDDSYLIHKLEGTQTVGERMPLGGPYLSEDEIAAIRQWITDGATESASMTGLAKTEARNTGMAAGWPVAGSTLEEPPHLITLIADGELDQSLLHDGSVQLRRVDRLDPLTGEAPLAQNVELQLSSLAPTVINLDVPEEFWQAGLYEVRVKGSGDSPVLTRAGEPIDGDGDGVPGGDFVLDFRIGSD